jgi:hypothetical protein
MRSGSNFFNNFWEGAGYRVDGQGTFRTRPVNSPIVLNVCAHPERDFAFHPCRTSRYNVIMSRVKCSGVCVCVCVCVCMCVSAILCL